MTHVLVATPTAGGVVKSLYATTLVKVVLAVKDAGWDADSMTFDGSYVSIARNYFANTLLAQSQFTHLVMINSDMSFDGHVICRLIRCGKPVVAAAYSELRMDLEAYARASRNPELTAADRFAVAMKYTLQPEPELGTRQVKVIDGMCRVNRISLGCSVIQRKAFEALIAAGMARLLPDGSSERIGLEGPFYDFFSEMTLEDGTRLSEDYSFCKRWRSLAGNEIWAAVDEPIGRVGDMIYGAPYLRRLLLSTRGDILGQLGEGGGPREATNDLQSNQAAMTPPKQKFNIALIFMPISELRPPLSLTSLPISVDLVMEELASCLALWHNVIAYCARGEGQEKIEQFNGVEYRRVSKFPDRRFLDSRWWYPQFISEVVADPVLQDCDIVHIMNLSEFVPVIRARLPKVRIVLHMECQWLEQLDATMIEQRINAADLVLGCSKFIAEGVRRRFPFMAQKCSHIYNGADMILFSRPPGVRPKPKQLLFVGRLAPEKGVHVLLDAFRIVLAHHSDAHLELIGPEMVLSRELLLPVCDDPLVLQIERYFAPGKYAELLRSKVSEMPAGSVSFFNKGMKFIELVPHYHSASIFAFPSVWEEPFGMPVVEAMASGTAVVATRGGAFPEIIEDGRSGLLVERSDVQGLADAILQLLSNPDQRDAMALAGLERASTMFSWDRVAENLVKEYEHLCG